MNGRHVLSALVTAAVLTACGPASPTRSQAPQPSPSPTGTAQPTARPTPSPSVTAAPTAAPTPSAVPTGTGTPAACWPLRGGGAVRTRIADLNAAPHPGYDRVVVAFTSAVPAYTVTVNANGPHFLGSASGLPIDVLGNAGLHLQLSNIDMPPAWEHGTDLVLRSAIVKEVRVTGAFEGIVDIAIGVDRATCPRVMLLASPPRLVLDFATS